VLHRTNDSFRATNPADEFLGPEPEEEDELPPEPTVEEVWDGRGEYVHVVTFATGEKFTIARQLGGAFSGDYSIHGKDYYADGYLDPQDAIERLFDMAASGG
jgi:hypothetical protein